ncbi:hypothetical protein LCGC14_1743360 [marine sediment metagenome]|uniref:Uncharacterized protein n=1 Tax=marine sediment metagenome TaxID=412755 RepID=A0A0F9JLB5_9ZZZZ
MPTSEITENKPLVEKFLIQYFYNVLNLFTHQ